MKIKKFSFGNDITLKLEKVFMLNEKKVNGDEVTFKANSPVLIEDKDVELLLPFHVSSALTPQLSNLGLQPFHHHFSETHDRILKDIRGD